MAKYSKLAKSSRFKVSSAGQGSLAEKSWTLGDIQLWSSEFEAIGKRSRPRGGRSCYVLAEIILLQKIWNAVLL